MNVSCPDDLVISRPEGLYCPPGDFYIEPWRPVDRAVITHAHSDHARVGHRHYLAHTDSAGTLRTRLGAVEDAVRSHAIGRTELQRGNVSAVRLRNQLRTDSPRPGNAPTITKSASEPVSPR